MPDDQSYSLPPTQSASLEVGQRVFRHYVLNRFLGRGALGAAWLVVHEGHGRELAMRFVPEAWLRDERAMAALREAVVKLLDVTHPNIVGVLDFVRDAQAAAIVARFVDGKTLHEKRSAAEEKFLPVSVLQAWLAQLCDALDFAWRRHNAIHGDLCPQNMLVTEADEFRVIDFGLARSLYDLQGPTGAPLITGTQAYLSPERARGLSVTATDDVYGFGATVYEMLTSRPVFFRGNVLWQLESVVPPSMTERRAEFGLTGESIPPEWEQVIAACLAKRREDRPRDIREVGEALGLLNPLTTGEDVPVPVVLPRSPDLNEPSPAVYSLRSEHPAPEFPSSLPTVSLTHGQGDPDLEVTQDAVAPLSATSSTRSPEPEDESEMTVAATEPPPKTPPAEAITAAPPAPPSEPPVEVSAQESAPVSAPVPPPPPSRVPPPPPKTARPKPIEETKTQSPEPEDESDQTVAATEPPPKTPPAAEIKTTPPAPPTTPPPLSTAPPLEVPAQESAPVSAPAPAPPPARVPPPPPKTARPKPVEEAKTERSPEPDDESDQTVAATEPPPKTPPAAEIKTTPPAPPVAPPPLSGPPPLPVPSQESAPVPAPAAAPPPARVPPPPPKTARPKPVEEKKAEVEAKPPTRPPTRSTPPPPPTLPTPEVSAKPGPVSNPLKWLLPAGAAAVVLIGAAIFALKPKGKAPSVDQPTPEPAPIVSTPPTPSPPTPTPVQPTPAPAPSGIKEVTVADLGPFANQGRVKEKLALIGEFRISSAFDRDVIARPTAKDLSGTVRVSARFSPGSQVPEQGSTVTWTGGTGLIVREVRRGTDGQLNIEVEKER